MPVAKHSTAEVTPKPKDTPRTRVNDQTKDGPPDPRLPHERDESPAHQGGAPQEVIEQAHEDIERGIADTDRRSATDLQDKVPSSRDNCKPD